MRFNQYHLIKSINLMIFPLVKQYLFPAKFIRKLDDIVKIPYEKTLEGLNKKYYEGSNLVLVEGLKAVTNVMKLGKIPKKIFYTRATQFEDLKNVLRLAPNCFRCVELREMQGMTSLKTICSVVGLFERPNFDTLNQLTPERKVNDLTIVADGLQDHVNLGTLIRAAALSGCRKVVCTSGCASIWSQKVVRSSQGAYFFIPIVTKCLHDNIWSQFLEGANIYVADMPLTESAENYAGQSTPYFEIDWTKRPNVVIIGNESTGLSIWSRELVRARKASLIHVPQLSKLNCLSATTTATVIAFESLRQNKRFLQPENLSDFVSS